MHTILILFILIALLALVAFAIKSHRDHLTLKQEKDKELDELKAYFAKEHTALEARVTDLKAKVTTLVSKPTPTQEHWADQAKPAAPAAVTPPPAANT